MWLKCGHAGAFTTVVHAVMSCIEKIPRALEEKFAAITALTDTFCEKYLNDEYRVLIHRVALAA